MSTDAYVVPLEAGPNERRKGPKIRTQARPKVKHTITIIMMEDGNMQINGPIHDRVLFFGLMELAKDMVREHVDAQRKQADVAAQVKGSLPWWKRIVNALS